MRKIKKIIIHCSDSTWGSAGVIKKWHLARGWTDCGYHYIILNGQISKRTRHEWKDGLIEPCRPIETAGAHCRGHNKDSIGICLIGKKSFSYRQMKSLTFLVESLKNQFPGSDVFGHNEFSKYKTCPNFKV